MSLYSEYIKERENKSIIEFDNAFVSYKINNNFLFIEDMYIRPEYRKNNISKLLDTMIQYEAINNKCKYIICSVSTLASNWIKSIKVIRHSNYKFYAKNKYLKQIYFIKEI